MLSWRSRQKAMLRMEGEARGGGGRFKSGLRHSMGQFVEVQVWTSSVSPRCTALLQSVAAAEEIRGALKHCCVTGAAWITAAVVTQRGFTLWSGLYFWHGIKYDPRNVLVMLLIVYGFSLQPYISMVYQHKSISILTDTIQLGQTWEN